MTTFCNLHSLLFNRVLPRVLKAIEYSMASIFSNAKKAEKKPGVDKTI